MESYYGNYKLKGTPEEIKEMKDIMSVDGIDFPTFNKYFILWDEPHLGNFYFPKEEYFVSRFIKGKWVDDYFTALAAYDKLFLRRLLKNYYEKF